MMNEQSEIASDLRDTSELVVSTKKLSKPVILNNRYAVHGIIEEGETGVVFKGEDLKSGALLAIKFYNDDISFSKRTLKEFSKALIKQSTLKNPHLVLSKDLIAVKNISPSGISFKRSHALIMEYAGPDYEPLTEFLDGSLTPDELNKIFPQLLSALSELHQAGITHRGVFPSNILYSPEKGTVKLADFSPFAFMDEKEYLTRNRAYMRAHYAPPQFYELLTTHYQADLYAVSIILLEAFTGDSRAAAIDAADSSRFSARVNHAAPNWIVRTLPSRYQYIVKTAIRENQSSRYSSAVKMAKDFGLPEEYYDEAVSIKSATHALDSYENDFYEPTPSEVLAAPKVPLSLRIPALPPALLLIAACSFASLIGMTLLLRG